MKEKVVTYTQFAVSEGNAFHSETEKALIEKVVTYMQFTDLEEFSEGHAFHFDTDKFMTNNLPSMMNGDPEDWGTQFEALDMLRVCNKHHSGLLIESLHLYQQFVKDSVDNLRSNISKNGLMFCTELLNNKEAVCEEKYR